MESTITTTVRTFQAASAKLHKPLATHRFTATTTITQRVYREGFFRVEFHFLEKLFLKITFQVFWTTENTLFSASPGVASSISNNSAAAPLIYRVYVKRV